MKLTLFFCIINFCTNPLLTYHSPCTRTISVNVSDPNMIQAAQHISPKPLVFKSSSHVNTPNSHMKVTTTHYSNSGQFSHPPRQQQNFNSNYYPSVPEFTPVRPPPPPPVAAKPQFQPQMSPMQQQPRSSYTNGK